MSIQLDQIRAKSDLLTPRDLLTAARCQVDRGNLPGALILIDEARRLIERDGPPIELHLKLEKQNAIPGPKVCAA